MKGLRRSLLLALSLAGLGLASEAMAQTTTGRISGTVLDTSGADRAGVTITVTEGKHRMVRRMLHNAGASVLALHRIAYGDIVLGDLAPCMWRAVATLT